MELGVGVSFVGGMESVGEGGERGNSTIRLERLLERRRWR